ncbi:MAG: Hsp20/alpha crystallin family protein [Treponemataceae bacterium]
MNWLLRNRDAEADGIDELDRVRRELARFFDSDDENSGLFDRSAAPAVDLIERTDGYVLYIDLPGVDKKDLELNVEHNVLSVKGEKKESKGSKGFFRKENWTGTFRRTISLPQAADPEKTQAELKDGVLTINIGKREELKPRQITVSVN